MIQEVQARVWAKMLTAALLSGLSGFAAERASAQPAVPLDPLGSSSLSSPYPLPAPGAPTEPNPQYETNIPPNLGIQPGPGFQFSPQLTLGEEFNDNIFQTESDRRWDLITIVAPGIAVADQTNRLKFNLNYSPALRIYARTPSQNSVAHQAFGVASAELVEDTFFVNARVFASLAPLNGGFANFGVGLPSVTNPGFNSSGGGSSLSKSNLTQVESAALTPYLVHRFGEFGTAKLGLNLQQSYTSNTGSISIGGPVGPASNIITTEAIGQFASGTDWGRFLDFATIDAGRTTGTGASAKSNESIISNKLGYAVRQSVIVFGEFGAESIHYHNVMPHIDITDGVWGIGTTLLPNDQSQITIEYGHHQGVTGFQGTMRYSITARTTISASYTSGLTTDLQDIQQQLLIAGVSPLGNAVALTNGAPVSLINALGGVTNQLYQSQQFNATISTVMDRNGLALTVSHQNRNGVAAFQSTNISSDSSTSVSGQWTHDISLRTQLSTTLSYGIRTSQPDQHENFYSLSAQLRYSFTDKLIGSAAYSFFDRTSNVPGVSMYDNLVFVALTRTF